MASSSTAPRQSRAARLVHRVDRLTAGLGVLGPGAFGWPVAIGTGLATTLALVVSAHVAAKPGPHPVALWMARGWPLALVMSVGVATLSVCVALLQKGRGDDRALVWLYRRTLHRMALLAALPVCLVFRESIEVGREWLTVALAGLTGVLATYSAYHFATDDASPTGARATWRPWVAGLSVGALVVTYATLTTHIAIINHLAFNTGRSDLGYYLSVFRQSSQGIPLGCSLCGGGSHVSGHFDPILVLLSPLFLIYPFAETLLVLQSVWLATGAVPVYLLTRKLAGHRGAGVALAAAYLAYPALHGVNFFDFHSIALCIPPLLWFLYFLEEERARAAYVTLGVALLVREDVSLATSLIGVSAIFSGVPKRRRIGWVTVALSAAYFVVAKVVFMGHADPLNVTAGGKGYAQFYDELIPVGGATKALVGTLIGDPLFSLSRILTEGKLDYVAQIFVPLLGLPLLARGRIQLAYGFAVTLLATAHLYTVHAQYSSTLIPVAFGLTASALGRLRAAPHLPLRVSGDRAARALSFGVLVSTLLCSWKFGGIVPNGSFIAGFRPLSRSVGAESLAADAWLRRVARGFPRGTKVAANTRIIPHIGCVTSLLMIDDRHRADYVIANERNPQIAHIIQPDVAKGYLVQVESLGYLHVYRTKYPPALEHVVTGDVEVEPPGGS